MSGPTGEFIDAYWSQALHTLEQARVRGPLLAPSEFAQRVPHVLPYAASHAHPPEHFAALALHKGRLNELAPAFLNGLPHHHQPVMANAVFVVFLRGAARSTDLHAGHYNAYLHASQAAITRPTPPRVHFIHLPRTGGTSLRRQLVPHVYAPHEAFPAQQYEELSRWDEFYAPEHGPLSVRGLHRYRFFGGHLGGGFVEQLLGEPVAGITVLRDPVEQLVSFYQYFLQSILPAHTQLVRDHPDAFSSLAAYVRSPFAVFNQQTRVLGYDPGPIDDPVALARANLASVGGIMPPMAPGEEPQRFEAAVRRLRSCVVVGLAEQRDGFYQQLEQALGWRLDAQVKLNITNPQHYQRIELDDTLATEIRQRQPWDVRLLEIARSLPRPDAPASEQF